MEVAEGVDSWRLNWEGEAGAARSLGSGVEGRGSGAGGGTGAASWARSDRVPQEAKVPKGSGRVKGKRRWRRHGKVVPRRRGCLYELRTGQMVGLIVCRQCTGSNNRSWKSICELRLDLRDSVLVQIIEAGDDGNAHESMLGRMPEVGPWAAHWDGW